MKYMYILLIGLVVGGCASTSTSKFSVKNNQAEIYNAIMTALSNLGWSITHSNKESGIVNFNYSGGGGIYTLTGNVRALNKSYTITMQTETVYGIGKDTVAKNNTKKLQNAIDKELKQ